VSAAKTAELIDMSFDKLYSPQMVVTAITTKCTIENDLTKKEKTNKQTHRQMACTYLKKTN